MMPASCGRLYWHNYAYHFFPREMEPRHGKSFIRAGNRRADGVALRDHFDPDPADNLAPLQPWEPKVRRLDRTRTETHQSKDQLGRCHMQTPLASPSVGKDSRDSILYGRRLSVVRFCTAIALLLITLAISFAQNGSGDSGAHGANSSAEFSSGMPLP